jgi:uncharacterized alpha-E superfamily protein
MLSRMAESLYWIGRYVERAEQTARVTDATLGHTLTMGSTPDAEARRARHWAALLEIVGERPVAGEQPDDEEQVTTHLLYASTNPNSIAECIARARENARTMRNMIATEMWEVLNRFHLDVQRPGRRRRRVGEGTEAASRFCTAVVDCSLLLQGVTNSTMPREEGWYFLQAGKFLERAEWTARVLDVNCRLLADDDALDAAPDDVQPWAALLRALSAYESYYRLSSSGIQPAGVIELLTLSPVLPRSIRFSVGEVEAALRHITDEAPAYNGSEPMPGAPTESDARREIGRLHAELAYQRLADMLESGVHPAFLGIQRRCYRIGQLVEDEFFAHRPLTAQEMMV